MFPTFLGYLYKFQACPLISGYPERIEMPLPSFLTIVPNLFYLVIVTGETIVLRMILPIIETFIFMPKTIIIKRDITIVNSEMVMNFGKIGILKIFLMRIRIFTNCCESII